MFMPSGIQTAYNQTVRAAKNAIEWSLGYNNLHAIDAVLKDEYRYHDWQAGSLIKLKQIGTELIHAGLKYTTLSMIADKSMVKIGILAEPEVGTFRDLTHRLAIGGATSLFTSWAMHIAGAASLGYAGRHCIKNVNEARRVLSRVVSKRYFDHSELLKDVALTTLHLGNAAISAPVFYSAYKYGPQGAAFAAPAFYLVNNHGNAAVKTAAAVAGVAVVIKTVPGIALAGQAASQLLASSTQVFHWIADSII
jgi:hypothetical protein